MLAEMNRKDLTVLVDLIQTGKVKPVIDRTYPFSQLPEAMQYLEEGHARGKVVLTVGENIEPLSPLANRTASPPSPVLVAFKLIGVPLGVLILPIIAAFVLNRRFKRAIQTREDTDGATTLASCRSSPVLLSGSSLKPE